MSLVSPGVEVTIIDQSQYLPAPTNSVPMVVVATAQNKADASGTAVAAATTAANANKLYLVTSQRDLVNLYGSPFFYTATNGTPIQGYELNEYGLLAAYSALGVTNRVYVLRANIDLAKLVGTTSRPAGAVTDGTYWLDTSKSTWGIYEFNNSTGRFANQLPIILTSASDISGNVPLASIGNIGDYAVYTPQITTSPEVQAEYFYKTTLNVWVPLGSDLWAADIPAMTGTAVPAALTAGSFAISTGNASTILNFAGTTLTQLVTAINAIGWPGLTAAQRDGRLVVFLTNNIGDSVTFTNITGTILNDIGVSSGVPYYAPLVQWGTAAQMPLWTNLQAQPRPSGSVWMKAGATGVGLLPSVSKYVQAVAAWQNRTVNLAPSDWSVTAALDSTGGKAITAGAIYAQYNYNNSYIESPIYLWERSATGPTAITGTRTTFSNPATRVLQVQTSVPGTANLSSTYTVTVPAGTSSLTGFIVAWTAANILYTTATLSSTGALVLTHTEGGEIIMNDFDPVTKISNGLLNDLGFVINSTTGVKYGPALNLSFPAVATTTSGVGIGATLNVFSEFGKYNVAGIAAAGSGYLVGDTITVNGNLIGGGVNMVTRVTRNTSASMTGLVTNAVGVGESSGTTLTVNSITPGSYFSAGQVVWDDGVTSGVSIVQQLTGTPGGVGTYQLSAVPGVPIATGSVLTNDSAVGENNTLVVSTMYDGTLAAGDAISTAGGVLIGTLSATAGTGTGGVGTYIFTTTVGAQAAQSLTANFGEVTGVAFVSGAPTVNWWSQLSNWRAFAYTPKNTAPVAAPQNATPWFYSTADQVDIMVQKAGAWVGYRNAAYDQNGHPTATGSGVTDPAGPIIAATRPTLQSDGTPLVYGDLWIDSSDLENYPRIYRWQQVSGENQWVAINTADQVSSSGMLFADARWATSGNVDPVNDPIPTITSLLTSNYLDLDAPSPSLYPQGMLLWNTRRSGYNVKEYQSARFTSLNYPGQVLPTYQNSWVTVSGNMSNGQPYMGRKAQRIMVVKAMRQAVDTNTAIRDEDNQFNLMCCPNYPELQPNMVGLNAERGYTGYILGDTPMRLPDSGTAIQAWATNAAGATSTGEDGLVTRDSYLGLFYPSGLATDLSGNEVAVPASHMMLRTFLRNDTIAYPWFAAAGTRRGLIDNALNIGYIDATTGEFVTTKTRIGIRDVLYTNQINPLVFFTGVGLLNFGNKSSFNSQSAMDRTNVGRLIAFIRRQLTLATRPFIFEPNDNITRQEVAGVVQTLMVDLVSKRGIYDYLVVCDESNNTPARIDRNELWLDLAIEPVKAVEFIYVPVRILNTGEINNIA